MTDKSVPLLLPLILGKAPLNPEIFPFPAVLDSGCDREFWCGLLWLIIIAFVVDAVLFWLLGKDDCNDSK